MTMQFSVVLQIIHAGQPQLLIPLQQVNLILFIAKFYCIRTKAYITIADTVTGTSDVTKTLDYIVKVLYPIYKEVALNQNTRLDPWTPSKVTREQNPDFKEKLIQYYKRMDKNTTQVKCMILDVYLPKHVVIGAHIWKASTLGRGMEAFGLRVPDVWSERNGILLYDGIEKKFDSKDVCFIYQPFEQILVLKVLNPSLLDQPVVVQRHAPELAGFLDSGTTWKTIDEAPLRLPHGVFPFKRILSWHAKCSVKWAVSNDWMTQAHADSVYGPYFNTSVGAIEPEELFGFESIS